MSAMVELVATNLSLKRNGKTLLQNVDVALNLGQVAAVIGENGAGKSTLLRLLAGYEVPDKGNIQVGGEALSRMSADVRARHIAWLPQNVAHAWPIRVRDAVAIGLYAAKGAPGGHSDECEHAINTMLGVCGLADLADRSTTSLSGGEMARVHIARTLISRAPIILVDEPVAALDPRYRHIIMDILRYYARSGAAVLVVLHDLALAARYADHIIGMRHGEIVVEGTAEAVVTPVNIKTLFDVDAHIDHSTGHPIPIYR
jgi:iron complex transport system ATP-binding protein